jgi:hypothetical protein
MCLGFCGVGLLDFMLSGPIGGTSPLLGRFTTATASSDNVGDAATP